MNFVAEKLAKVGKFDRLLFGRKDRSIRRVLERIEAEMAVATPAATIPSDPDVRPAMPGDSWTARRWPA
jgi:hypothetical protein